MKLLWFLNCQHGYHKWRNVFFNIVIYVSKNILKGCITLKRHINYFLNLWWIFWDSSVVLFLSAQNRKKYYSVCVVHFQISHDKKVDLKAFFYVSNWIFLVYLQKKKKKTKLLWAVVKLDCSIFHNSSLEKIHVYFNLKLFLKYSRSFSLEVFYKRTFPVCRYCAQLCYG